jgi:ATP-binding cassette subfamily F protein 3
MLASPLLRLEDASVGYAAGQPVLSRLDLRIDQDDRIALLGQNGNGKSTFAKLISGRLPPLSGQVFGINRVQVGYFAQHQLDELNPLKSPYDHFAALMPDATEAQKRTRLGSCGFGADKADTKAGKLSGGEKARLLLALTAFHAPHLLILDEPTNHLDIDARESLIHALNDYNGAVIIISHDRHLIEASAERLWIVGNGTVAPYDGDLDSYRSELLAQRTQRDRTGNSPASAEARAGRAEQRRDAAQRRAEIAPLKKALQDAEKEIAAITDAIARLDQALADPNLYARDPQNAQQLSLERGRLAKTLAAAEERWLETGEAYEAAAAAPAS